MSETESNPRPHRTTERERLELELLVARCQLGEADAFDELVARWHEPLWRYVLAMTGDPAAAEEIVQDGWLRILRGIDRLRQPDRLQPWLFSIVRRTLADRLRKRYTDAVLAPLSEPLEGELADPEPPSDLGWEESESLHRALAALTEDDRETVILFYLRELDLREVAQVLGIPVGTVKSRLHRARRLLRSELESQGVTP